MATCSIQNSKRAARDRNILDEQLYNQNYLAPESLNLLFKRGVHKHKRFNVYKPGKGQGHVDR